MADVQRTRQADIDLLEIWAYIAENNFEAANSTIQAIGRRCYDCADLPGIGRRHEDLSPGLRSITEGSYIIFYRVAEEGIQVVRVVHGTRDLPSLFDQDQD